MLIHFHNETKIKEYMTKIEQVFDSAFDYLGFDANLVEVELNVVSPRQIKRINKEYRGVSKVTDILSFPTLLDPDKNGMQLLKSITKEQYPNDMNYETGKIMLGSMYLNFKQAKKQAKQYETGLTREVVYLCLHSLLHLIGYDHMVESDKKVMREVEESILAKNEITR